MAVPGRAGRLVAVRIDGLSEAKEALAALPEAFRSVVAESIKAGAAIIQEEAVRRAPMDEGDLLRSIGTNIRGDGLQAAVGSGVFYAPFVEFGTNDTPAQPYLYPGFRLGAKYVRKQIRTWAAEAGRKVRLRTKRGKRANRGPTAT